MRLDRDGVRMGIAHRRRHAGLAGPVIDPAAQGDHPPDRIGGALRAADRRVGAALRQLVADRPAERLLDRHLAALGCARGGALRRCRHGGSPMMRRFGTKRQHALIRRQFSQCQDEFKSA